MKYPKATSDTEWGKRHTRKKEVETKDKKSIERERWGGEEDYSSENDTAGRINKDSKSFLCFFLCLFYFDCWMRDEREWELFINKFYVLLRSF